MRRDVLVVNGASVLERDCVNHAFCVWLIAALESLLVLCRCCETGFLSRVTLLLLLLLPLLLLLLLLVAGGGFLNDAGAFFGSAKGGGSANSCSEWNAGEGMTMSAAKRYASEIPLSAVACDCCSCSSCCWLSPLRKFGSVGSVLSRARSWSVS